MKKILMLGSISGIGQATLKRIIDKDYYFYLTGKTDKQINLLKEKYKNYTNIEYLKVNVLEENDFLKIKKLDIDILINFVGIGYGGSLIDMEINKIKENFDVNVFSNLKITQIVLQKMFRKDEGKIIFISSLASIFPLNFLGSYSSTKASLNIISDILRKEVKLLTNNIKIVLVRPGMYHTGFNQVMLENKYNNIDNLFKDQIENIRKRENFIFNLLEKKKLNSIAKKIEKAIISSNPNNVYNAPVLQTIFSKLYQLFKG